MSDRVLRRVWRSVAAALALAVAVSPAALARGERVVGRLGETPALREALRTSVYGNYIAGLAATSARDVKAASVFWRAALRHDPRNAELAEKAFYATLTNGELDEAFTLAERVVQSDKGNRLARLALAVRAAREGQFGSARTQLMQGVNPLNDVASILLVAWSQVGGGKVDEGIKVIHRLSDQDWFLLFKTYHMGLMYDVAGQAEKAGQKLEAAYKQSPSFLRAVDAYGRWLSRNKSPEEARATYSAFAKSVTTHPIAERMQAELIAGKTLPPMVKTAQQGMAEALFGLGSALIRQDGGEGQGLVYLQLALALQPDHDLAQFSLGELFDQLKQPDRAIETYRQVAATSPLKRNAEMQVAISLEAQEKHDEAIKQLKTLVAESPKDIDALQLLGSVYRARKSFPEASAVYSQAIDTLENPLPQHWPLFYFRGVTYERQKLWPKAEPDFKRALELVPDSNGVGKAQVLNYLGYSWIDQGMNLEEGLKLVKKAVELQPESGYIVDSLGWAYYRLGRYDDAVKELERAMELKPDDPVLNDHLGDAYWRVGRRLEAEFQWNHARDYKPEPEDLARILEKLKNGLADDGTPATVPPPPIDVKQ